jgi:hypothetical protein
VRDFFHENEKWSNGELAFYPEIVCVDVLIQCAKKRGRMQIFRQICRENQEASAFIRAQVLRV